jgi:hypothetical protein
LTLPVEVDPDCLVCFLPIRGTKAFDHSGNGLHGVFDGAGFVSKGRFGPSLDLSPPTKNCSIPDNALLNFTSEDFAMHAWIFPTDLDANRGLCRKAQYNQKGYQLAITSAGRLIFYTFQAGANQQTRSANGAIVLNKWHHVAVSRTGTSAIMYVNSVDVNDSVGTHTDPVAATGFGFEFAELGVLGFIGQMDELHVLTRTVSATEVKQLYEQGRP